MTFKDEKQLEKFLLQKCKAAVAEAEQKVHQVIDRCLDQYYGEFKPDEYIRTYQLLHSLVKSGVAPDGNGFKAIVEFDASKMNYQTGVVPLQSGGTGYATWGAAEVLDTAMHGSHGGYIDGTAIWDTSLAVLGDIYKLLERELKAQGIPIKKG